MHLEWIDVIKIAMPLVTAIVMVWIKNWGEMTILRGNKQHALSRLISDQIGELEQTVEALRRIAESAKNGNLRLISINVSTLISKLALDLSELEAKFSYCYSDLISSVEIVNVGLSRLSTFVMNRASAIDVGLTSQIDHVIIAQSKIVAVDFVSLSKSSFKVLDKIPMRKRYQDAQALNTLETAINSAERNLDNWPSLPPIVK